jgi:hypothetical protein
MVLALSRAAGSVELARPAWLFRAGIVALSGHLLAISGKKAGDLTMWKRDEEAGRQQGFRVIRARR